MSHLLSTIRCADVAAILAVCLVLPGLTWAKDDHQKSKNDDYQQSNHGQPFDQILEALRGVTQNWDKKLKSTNGDTNGCNSDRFTCIFPDATFPDGAAVRDNETGLVWERSPDGESINWYEAIRHCANLVVSDRKGWALPLKEQLGSLVDTSGTMALPSAHPFLNVIGISFYAATTDAERPSDVWGLEFDPWSNGRLGGIGKAVGAYAWCVRGGQRFDGNTHTPLP